jgi:valyl-tRNA synthetase
MNLDPRRLEGARNFTNKVWQAARFVLSALEEREESLELPPLSSLLLPDLWILSRLNRLVQDVTRLFESYQYGEAGRQVYDFLWGEYCDWYIEASKVRLYNGGADRHVPCAVLLHVLDVSLRLLHPFMPFLTEAIWQALPRKAGTALMMSRWPEPDKKLISDEAEARMGTLMELIRGIRNRRAEYDVTPGRRIPALIAAGPATGWLNEQRDVMCLLARLDPARLAIEAAFAPPDQAATVVVGEIVCYLPLAGLVDLEAEREKLAKSLAEVEERIARSEALLSSDFVNKAPSHIVQRERDKLADLHTERARLQERLAELIGGVQG